jgi:hypothetical protein
LARSESLFAEEFFVFTAHGKIRIAIGMLTCTGHPFLVDHIGAFFSLDLGKIDVVDFVVLLHEDVGEVFINIGGEAFAAKGTTKLHPFTLFHIEIRILVGGVISNLTVEHDKSPLFPFIPGHENDVVAHS